MLHHRIFVPAGRVAAFVLACLLATKASRAVTILAKADANIYEPTPDVNNGDGFSLYIRSRTDTTTRHDSFFLQFDISSLTTLTSATLRLTADRATPSNSIYYFGLFQSQAGAWTEETLTYNNAPGVFADGTSIRDETGTTLQKWDLVAPTDPGDNSTAIVTSLGNATKSTGINSTTHFSSAALLSFLNTAIANGDNTVTFTLRGGIGSESILRSFYSREATDDLDVAGVDTLVTDAMRPNLIFELAPQPPRPADFDGDGDVDGADFVAWQTNFPKATGATLAEGDTDGDGDVDGADFVVWHTNFPTAAASESAPIPEPTGLLLAIGGVLAFLTHLPQNQ